LASAQSKITSGNGVPRQPTRLTRGRLLLGVVLIFLLGGVAAALDLRLAGGGVPRSVLPNSLLVLDAESMKTLRDVAGGRLPPRPAVVRGGGLVWSVDRDANTLVGRTPASKRVVRTVVVGTEPVAVAVGFGSVWVANSGNGSVTRVELGGSRVETLGLNDQPSAIATGAGHVWVLSSRSRNVLRIDPETNLVTKKVRLSQPPLGAVVRSGRVRLGIGD
jgi:DNA-binding beta-propeller fold protein YncE